MRPSAAWTSRRRSPITASPTIASTIDPEGFLPQAFSGLRDPQGWRGGRHQGELDRRPWAARPAGCLPRSPRPEPGRRLVETGDGVVTTFTVAPSDGGCVVRFDTVFDEPGLDGVLLRLFIGRMLGPLYADELERLAAYSGRHGPLSVAA